MKHLTLTAAAAALLFAPTTAHAQLFGGFDNNTLLGGAVGAGLGGALGSNLAGAGNRDEGTAIGAALGGLAGAAYGNRNSRYGGNPFAGSFNPGFTGNSLLGTVAGAGIGGVIGSNLAGSGVQQEGTAIGALIGGLAGNALTSGRSRYGNRGFANPGFAPAGPIGFPQGGFPQGGFAPAGFGPAFPPAPFAGPIGVPPMAGPQLVPGGFVTTGIFPSVQPAPAPLPVLRAPAPQIVNYAAPAPRIRYINNVNSTVTQDYTGSDTIVLRSPRRQKTIIDLRDNSVVSGGHTHSHMPAPVIRTRVIASPAPVFAPAPAPSNGTTMNAETININYGDNSQVGTSGSVNGSTYGGYAGGYSAGYAPVSAPISLPVSQPAAPIYVDSGYAPSYTTGSNRYGDAPIAAPISAPISAPIAAPIAAPIYSGGSANDVMISSGQSFTVPSSAELAANCAGTTFGCAGGSAQALALAYAAPLAAAPTVYAPTTDVFAAPLQSTGGSYKVNGYSYCDSDKVYNNDGAELLGATPYCR